MDYFSGKLKKKDRHAFEKTIMQDSFESEAFDGLSKISSSELAQDMSFLEDQLEKRTKKKRRIPIWLPYAASIAIILSLSSVLFYVNQYSTQDEMIGAQMEESLKKTESPIVKQEIVKSDSELVDSVKIDKNDSALQISEVKEIAEVEIFEEKELIIVEEEKEDVEEAEISKELYFAEPQKKSIARVEMKNELDLEISSKVEESLTGQVAGVEVNREGDSSMVLDDVSTRMIKSKKASFVAGRIVDENKDAMPGVSVVIKGTNRGTTSDVDGKFKLNVADVRDDYKLTANFIGYESKEIEPIEDSTLFVVLEMDNVSMDEVVVVGYGTSTSKTERGNTKWEKAKPNLFASVSKFEEYLTRELENGNLDHLQGIHKVKLTFVVEAYGELSKIKFKGNPDELLAKEVMRLLLDSGDWYPAESGDKAIASKVRISLKLNFD